MTDGPAKDTAATGGTRGTRVVTSVDPRTGELAGTYALMGAGEISRTVREARSAGEWWGALGFAERKRWLLDWKRDIARRAGELAELISQETGKPQTDALIEVMLAVEHLDWAAHQAASVLGRHSVASGWLGHKQSASLGYLPLGVVGVIGPWNFPIYTPMGSIAYALAAGNAVVFKASELTPGTGTWLADSWNRLAPNQPVLQVITGDAKTGEALCRARVDKISFTGTAENARRILRTCAETMTPAIVEGGGKSAMIVHVDAKLDDAADSAVYGSMGNAGQIGAGVERVYVAESVYQPFLDLVVAKARKLKPGADQLASYGPMTVEAQADVVRKHVRDALARGAEAVVGGLDSIREPYIEPIVLTNVPEDSIAMSEETFGPVLLINKVSDTREAVSKINATGYGLTASIFTRDIATAEELAEQLRVSAVNINAVLAYATIPALPFGGLGESGQGRTHGADGLREFSRALSVTRRRRGARLNLLTLYRKPRHVRIVKALFKLKHAR